MLRPSTDILTLRSNEDEGESATWLAVKGNPCSLADFDESGGVQKKDRVQRKCVKNLAR
jgi:hypothetical protein